MSLLFYACTLVLLYASRVMATVYVRALMMMKSS